MNSSPSSIILTATIIAIVIVASFASLFVLDLVPRKELQDVFTKILLVIVIFLGVAFAVRGVLKLSRQ